MPFLAGSHIPQPCGAILSRGHQETAARGEGAPPDSTVMPLQAVNQQTGRRIDYRDVTVVAGNGDLRSLTVEDATPDAARLKSERAGDVLPVDPPEPEAPVLSAAHH